MSGRKSKSEGSITKDSSTTVASRSRTATVPFSTSTRNTERKENAALKPPPNQKENRPAQKQQGGHDVLALRQQEEYHREYVSASSQRERQQEEYHVPISRQQGDHATMPPRNFPRRRFVYSHFNEAVRREVNKIKKKEAKKNKFGQHQLTSQAIYVPVQPSHFYPQVAPYANMHMPMHSQISYTPPCTTSMCGNVHQPGYILKPECCHRLH